MTKSQQIEKDMVDAMTDVSTIACWVREAGRGGGRWLEENKGKNPYTPPLSLTTQAL